MIALLTNYLQNIYHSYIYQKISFLSVIILSLISRYENIQPEIPMIELFLN